jgi:hypothetical protein
MDANSPAPWHAQGGTIFSNDGVEIAEVYPCEEEFGGWDSFRANVELIVAAPEWRDRMLRVAKLVEVLLDDAERDETHGFWRVKTTLLADLDSEMAGLRP